MSPNTDKVPAKVATEGGLNAHANVSSMHPGRLLNRRTRERAREMWLARAAESQGICAARVSKNLAGCPQKPESSYGRERQEIPERINDWCDRDEVVL